MQTFLPYASFEATAQVLDSKRLGKQRVEVIQILRALTVPGYAWASHPAVLMWKGYEEALGRYGLTMCDVWTDQGFGDTCATTIAADLAAVGVERIRSYDELEAAGALPPWLTDAELQRSHRSALVRKDPEYYGPLFPEVPPDLPYHWPHRSPAVIERERKKAENAERRNVRAQERAAEELAKARRRRSLAAKRGWRTRAARAREANHNPGTGKRPRSS
jgi:Pyrimidine dimer DNA glycosylase